ncbi:autotransporter outer membrane beta-barrel domain-containing protein [Leptotrichia alba]|uniref:Autotransporter outer membrane beta-barrel domain-containing protein n=1 Tax=Leptotrichia alba TaxID=3239304 RepID=A0AB39V6A0_9FUSO
MKRIRNVKRLVLLTALCAIISCGGGGGGGKGSNNPRPTNPPSNPSNPGDPGKTIGMRQAESRYTRTKLEDMTDKDYLKDFRFKEAVDKNEIKYEEYGYKAIVDSDNFYPSSLTTMNTNGITYSPNTTPSVQKIVIKDGGIGLNVESDIYFNPSARDQEDKDKLDYAINKIITQFANKFSNLREVEINEGGTFIAFDGVWNEETENNDRHIKHVSLRNDSEYEFGRYDGTPYGVNLKITGSGSLFKYKDFVLKIDEDVDLDVSSNKYYKMLKRMINPKVHVEENIKISGNKDNQIGVRSIGPVDDFANSRNKGNIELKGNNTIGAFVKNSLFINEGIISINKNSTGIYAIYDRENINNHTLDGTIFNTKNIMVGENSTGMHIYSKYDNINMRVYNDSPGGNFASKSSIMANKNADNAVGMLLDFGEEKSEIINNNAPFIINSGIIDLKGNRSTGMYLTGKGEVTVFNYIDGRIIIGDSKNVDNPGIGMYSDNPNGTISNAPGVINGFIEVGKNSIGMAGVNGTTVKNEVGNIVIKGDNSIGMYLSGGTKGFNNGTIKTEGAPKNVIGVFVGQNAEFTNNGNIIINSEGGAGIVVAGGIIKNYGNIQVSGGAVRERVESPLLAISLSDRKIPVKKDMRVYVDSLGKTNPIEGLANLGLENTELLIGAEATEKTNATEVTVGKDVLDPFNKSIKESNIPYWTVGSGSLIWEADPEIKDNRVEKVTLRKQSYTKFADEKTKDVAEGLDEKYVVASEKDKQIFNYMNTLRDAESLGKAYKEIAGSQYINVQQRINQTDNLLDNQISSLQKDNAGKAGHHVETFFNKDKHDFKTEEVPNTTSTAFGASYLFNNTDSNWGAYGGVAINNYKFKDKGHSKESVSMLKAGGYKKFDLSIGDLDWTLGGDVFVSQNSMKRRIMTDKVYENKADYNAYGFSVKNEISKTYELGENSTIKPYGALKIGYGSFGKIKEKDAAMGLDVKGNSYYSVKPAAGIELGYSKQVTDKAKLKASLDLAYEHELGKVDHKENEIKFINARTGYKRESAKDESRGNLSTGVKVGLETGRFNFSVKGGYDTKDKNAHVGVGIGASF